jgi:hypothetical protein
MKLRRSQYFGYKFGYRRQFALISANYVKLQVGTGLAGSLITLDYAYHRLTVFMGNSKSADRKVVGVRPPLPAPPKIPTASVESEAGYARSALCLDVFGSALHQSTSSDTAPHPLSFQ